MIKNISSKLNTVKNAGFTLVELVVSMTLTAIFATALVAIMPAATRIYMQVEDMSRAQVVADMVVDALREECADTYIEDYASVRIVYTNPTSAGDSTLLNELKNSAPSVNNPASPPRNVLIIRKSSGYCEAISSCIAISESNYGTIKDDDKAYKFDVTGVSSRAVYRLFPPKDVSGNDVSEETMQGYVHYGYYQCGRANVTEGSNTISCIFPAIRYDYTVPFNVNSYSGYSVDLEFSNLEYTLAPGETDKSLLYNLRPSSVIVTVKVYLHDYESRSSEQPIYTRTAILVFEEDTTK